MCRRTFRTCSGKYDNRSFKILSKDGLISCWSIKNCRKGRKSCRAYRTKRSSVRRIWANGLDIVSGSQIEEHGQKNQKASMAEVELNKEIRSLQADDERRGNSASQSNGCCFVPAMVEHFHTMGAAQAWQQLSFVQGDLSKVYGVQHHPVPATPLHTPKGDEHEEEQKR